MMIRIHGADGTWGNSGTGLFASTAINSAGKDGLLFSNPGQLWVQYVGVAATRFKDFVPSDQGRNVSR